MCTSEVTAHRAIYALSESGQVFKCIGMKGSDQHTQGIITAERCCCASSHLNQDLPFLADIPKESPPAASTAVQAQPPGACNCYIYSIWADGGMCEGVTGCYVLLGHAYVLYPQLGSRCLLTFIGVWPK